MALGEIDKRAYRWSGPVLLLLLPTSHQANAGLDHELGYDKDRLYSQSLQTGLEASVIAVEVTGAL
jgi:hypothetical protein